MVQRARKKTLLLLGFIVGGITGLLGGYLKANFSKETSLFVSVASADVAPWGGVYDGDGGCSGGDTGDSGGDGGGGGGGGGGCGSDGGAGDCS